MAASEKAADSGPPIPDWAAGDAATEAPFVLEVIKDGVPVPCAYRANASLASSFRVGVASRVDTASLGRRGWETP